MRGDKKFDTPHLHSASARVQKPAILRVDTRRKFISGGKKRRKKNKFLKSCLSNRKKFSRKIINF